MAVLKKTLKILFAVLLGAMLAAPIGLLLAISRAEQAQYKPVGRDFELQERAYGSVESVFRTDMPETITLSGRMVSVGTLFMDLDPESASRIRFTVSVGDAVSEGQTVGYLEGREIRAEVSGVIEKIAVGDEAYIQLCDPENIALEIFATQAQLAVLKRGGVGLAAAQGGVAVSLYSASLVREEDGSTRVLLKIDDGSFWLGQSVEGYVVSTGRVFANALAVSADCVYSSGGAMYVREVDEKGIFKRETEVKTGYSDGKYICVSGIDEGTFCDGGYKAFVGQGGE